MWKPGQLITINGRVYRVKRINGFSRAVICSLQCDMWLDDKSIYPVCERKVCKKICSSRLAPMPKDCYLKRVKPKHI